MYWAGKGGWKKMYKYQMYENNMLVDEGKARELTSKYGLGNISIYANQPRLYNGKYKVIRTLYPFYPKENEVYYYYSLFGKKVCQSYWNSEKGECITNHKIGNVFKRRDHAQEYGKPLLEQMQNEYIKERAECCG